MGTILYLTNATIIVDEDVNDVLRKLAMDRNSEFIPLDIDDNEVVLVNRNHIVRFKQNK